MKKIKDYYYHLAKQKGFSARSVFKLQEIDQKYQLIHPSMHIMDLGASPGSWSEYIIKILNDEGSLISIDQNALKSSILGQPRHNFRFIQCDIKHLLCNEAEKKTFPYKQYYDLVLSDMAPKTSGNRLVDQEGSLQLLIVAFQVAQYYLKPGGHFVAKVFQNEDLTRFAKEEIKSQFQHLRWFKPKSSRSESCEMFMIALHLMSESEK